MITVKAITNHKQHNCVLLSFHNIHDVHHKMSECFANEQSWIQEFEMGGGGGGC